jgi:hypothetical protein
MMIIKVIQAAVKYGKKLNQFLKPMMKKETDQTAEIMFNSSPFYSVFASLHVQKRKNSAFLMLGNDVFNIKLPKECQAETDELSVDANVSVKMKGAMKN